MIGQLPRCYAGVDGAKSYGRDGKTSKRGVRVIMYVPKRLKPDDSLVRILGWHDAKRLVDAFGGEILQPASCAEIYRRFRDQSAIRMAREGMKPDAIAELLGVSDRHVRNLLREIPQEDAKAANDNNPPSSLQRSATMQPITRKQVRR
ncbi:hypothetical protein [Pseudomonas phage Persinger]|uniref:Mor transcription activator domain-containing protein n=1 Tax=Pseudomonas phage Persinger TaxID=2749430 RepID=A0A7D7IUH2_9CAUD|nr:late transcriptional activator [Pseudomonas phage Persinger]QMP19222.1 hypothetical protein [Pseudomonas phage Persinger]